MQSHGNLILRLYGQARGQAAEFLGEDYLGSDRWVQTMGIPNRANAWYESQNPIFRNYLDAFVSGMNAYAKEHPEALTEELKVALPLKPADVLAHGQRVINFTFIVDPARVENLAENPTPKGSNAWGSLLPILKAAMPCYWQILTFLGLIYFYGTKHN